MYIVWFILTSLITALLVFIILYFFFFRKLFKLMNEERVRFYTEQDLAFKESMQEIDKQIEEKKEDCKCNLLKKE